MMKRHTTIAAALLALGLSGFGGGSDAIAGETSSARPGTERGRWSERREFSRQRGFGESSPRASRRREALDPAKREEIRERIRDRYRQRAEARGEGLRSEAQTYERWEFRGERIEGKEGKGKKRKAGAAGRRGRRKGQRSRNFQPLKDVNGDGLLTRDEVPEEALRRFDFLDADGDGVVEEAERASARKRLQSTRRNKRGADSKRGAESKREKGEGQRRRRFPQQRRRRDERDV